MIDFIKSLGWKETDVFNNRIIYKLTEHCPYYLMEHNGDIGIVHNNEFLYYELDKDDIGRFTDILLVRDKMYSNPKDYTLYQALQINIRLKELLIEFERKY